VALGQYHPPLVSPIDLIANAQKYDKREVTVQGYLLFFHERNHVIAASLYLHEEDAKNRLPNAITVVPNERMLRDEEKIDRKYVTLTGLFFAVRSASSGSYESGVIPVIKDVRSCTPWSDPSHPIGNQNNGDAMVK